MRLSRSVVLLLLPSQFALVWLAFRNEAPAAFSARPCESPAPVEIRRVAHEKSATEDAVPGTTTKLFFFDHEAEARLRAIYAYTDRAGLVWVVNRGTLSVLALRGDLALFDVFDDCTVRLHIDVVFDPALAPGETRPASSDSVHRRSCGIGREPWRAEWTPNDVRFADGTLIRASRAIKVITAS